MDINPKEPIKHRCRFIINGIGRLMTFHPTGYPATYKTIVKNRLFSRQMERNAQGEVISGFDLDIPKPWTDAPKTQTP